MVTYPPHWDSPGLSGKFLPLPRVHYGAAVDQPPLKSDLPPPHLRHFYGYRNGVPDDALYLSGGQSDCLKLFQTLSDIAPNLALNRVLDFGCSAGRVTRHIPTFTEAEIWGVDIHAEAIQWASHNLPTSLRFFTTTTQPHLPFRDGHFDLIFAGSVFTHLDELSHSWLMELSRITDHRGWIALSFSHEHTQQHMRHVAPDHISHVTHKHLRPNHPKSHFITGSSPWSIRSLKNRQRFIAELCDLFHFQRIREFGYGWQSLAILKPR